MKKVEEESERFIDVSTSVVDRVAQQASFAIQDDFDDIVSYETSLEKVSNKFGSRFKYIVKIIAEDKAVVEIKAFFDDITSVDGIKFMEDYMIAAICCKLKEYTTED